MGLGLLMSGSWQLEYCILADSLAAVTAARMKPEARRRFWDALRLEMSRRRADVMRR